MTDHLTGQTRHDIPCVSRLGVFVNTRTGEVREAGCKRWTCAGCGPRRVRRFIARIKSAGLYRWLITLTLAGDAEATSANAARLHVGWRALYRHLRRTAGLGHYAWVRELGDKHGRLHMHAIVDAGRFDFRDARAVIARSGLGPVCDFSRLKRSHAATRYVSAYLSKTPARRFPRYMRRVQTSVSNAYFERDPDWIFMRAHRPAHWRRPEVSPLLLPTHEELEYRGSRQLPLALTKKEKLSAHGP